MMLNTNDDEICNGEQNTCLFMYTEKTKNQKRILRFLLLRANQFVLTILKKPKYNLGHTFLVFKDFIKTKNTLQFI